MSNVVADLMDEMDAAIAYAAENGLTLEPRDFDVIDGWLYVDGMDPAEWVDALTMD